MKYCKDFDHYTSLILAQHPFMCIIMHFSSHYTNNMQRLHKIIVLCNASCKLFLFLSSLSAFSVHYYYLQPARQAKQEPARQAHQKPARQAKQEPARPLHQKPARLPAARRIIRKENQKTKFFNSLHIFLFRLQCAAAGQRQCFAAQPVIGFSVFIIINRVSIRLDIPAFFIAITKRIYMAVSGHVPRAVSAEIHFAVRRRARCIKSPRDKSSPLSAPA